MIRSKQLSDTLFSKKGTISEFNILILFSDSSFALLKRDPIPDR